MSALPTLSVPTYEVALPSTGKKIKYRPFLVKEEKILLLAMEENTATATHQAVLDLVNACTFGEIGAKTDPMFDIEYAFLKIRQKSISETVTVNLLCSDDNKTYVETHYLNDNQKVSAVAKLFSGEEPATQIIKKENIDSRAHG